jgi:hypothetical protein
MIATTKGTLIIVLMSATFGAACSDTREASADTPEVSADSPEATAVIPEASSDPQEMTASLFDVSRILVGLRISPVPLNLQHRNRILVGLGSYMVNASGGCNDCHTQPSFAPGGDPFQGQPAMVNSAQYLAGGRQFGPMITSANITPDAQGRPAGLTFEQFKSVFRTGRDPRAPDHILQVMPWPVFRNLVDADIRAIYEYLSAIPSKPNNPNPG